MYFLIFLSALAGTVIGNALWQSGIILFDHWRREQQYRLEAARRVNQDRSQRLKDNLAFIEYDSETILKPEQDDHFDRSKRGKWTAKL